MEEEEEVVEKLELADEVEEKAESTSHLGAGRCSRGAGKGTREGGEINFQLLGF